MALINCPKCGQAISDKATKCPKCGYSLQKEEVIDIAAEPQKEETLKSSGNKKIKRVVVFGIISVLIIAAIVGIIGVTKVVNEKKKAEEYMSNLSLASITMLSGASDAERAGGLIHDVWYNSIYEKSSTRTDKYTKPNGSFVSDFNKALANLFSDKSFISDIESIEKNQETVASIMKKLINPSEEHKEAYSALKDLYEVYTDLCECAVNPTGSLNSYTADFNEADSGFAKCYKALNLYLE